MLKTIKHLLHRNKLTIAILITISIAILSFINIKLEPVEINHLDKFKHFIAYFSLSLSWLIALASTKTNNYYILFCCVVYGIIIEAIQGVATSHRFADVFDVLANTTGILIAYIIYLLFFKKCSYLKN